MARILLVDDEDVIVIMLSKLLKNEGYDVVGIQDGNKAVDLLKSEEEFDLLISDIRMRPVNGMELLKLARKERPSMAVVMVTGYDLDRVAAEALKMGAFEYLAKPFKLKKLLATVKRAIEHKG